MGVGGDPRAASRASCAANQPSREQQRADARMRPAAGQVVAARRSAALRTRLEPEMLIAAGRGPGGDPDGRRWRSARASAARVDRVIGSYSGRTRGRG